MSVVFAAVGDVHGHMRRMVRLVEAKARAARVEVQCVLQVGDFEPHRDLDDVATMAAPAKYRHLGDFHLFHQGKARFPWPVWFIGGNHEPYGFLDRLEPGAAVADNCFWFGRTGRRTIGGLDVAGLSGIAVEGKANTPRPPIEQIGRTKKKAYIHFTEDEVAGLLSDDPVDVLLVHDWPRGAYTDDTPRRRADRPEEVGNEWARLLVDTLRPQLVLAGHMHWHHRSRIGESAFVGLSHVEGGASGVALFRVRDGRVEQID